MSDVSKTEAEGAEFAQPPHITLLTYVVGVLVIGLAFFIACSPLFERVFHH